MAPAPPVNNTEKLLLKIFHEVLGPSKADFGVETNLIEWGTTSIDIIKLKGHLQLGFAIEISLATILSYPTARDLSRVISERATTSRSYKPVVILQHRGKKVPLWLFHPDNGDVLSFLGLAKQITDRPLYALRARGFNAGETCFSSVIEAAKIYHAAIKTQQPDGPYALAGHECGSMIAFEVAKLLGHSGDEVRFFSAFNFPPHSWKQSGQIEWSLCLLDVPVSLGLLSEQHKTSVAQYFPMLAKGEAVQHIQHASDPARMAELCLSADTLADWADVAFSLQIMAGEYTPTGKVDSVDVFWGQSPRNAEMDEEEWFAEHLSRWEGFGRDSRFHEIGGGVHNGVFGMGSAASVQRTLSKAMMERGV